MPTPRNLPIWAKRAGMQTAPSTRMLAYCAGRDVVARPPADAELIPYDLWTNAVHVKMLCRAGIIPTSTQQAIQRELNRLERTHREGLFQLDPALEDVHMNVERFVASIAGEKAAGAMHTARSRNDQSATDMRMWLRDRLLDRLEAVAGLIATIARLASRNAKVICPGFTHGQPAMPTTLGHWLTAHGWALARDADALRGLWPSINQCPLGAAAAFGTSWPIDRRLTAHLLGFDAPQPNSLDAISTRWEAEARLGSALGILMTHLSSIGQDLILMTTPPRRGVRLSDAHVTGSSIMPQKRNPDFAEVTRARALAVHSLVGNLMGVTRGALSGYNRDTQWTKYWIMDLLDEVGETPEIFGDVLDGLQIDRRELKRSATEGFSLAADLADHLANTRGVPFRRAYHVIAEAVARDEKVGWVQRETMNDLLRREKIKPLFGEGEIEELGRPDRAIARRKSLGGPAPDDVAAQARALRKISTDTLRWARTHQGRLTKLRLATRKYK